MIVPIDTKKLTLRKVKITLHMRKYFLYIRTFQPINSQYHDSQL